MTNTPNRLLWADEPHIRPTTKEQRIRQIQKEAYMPDPRIPLEQQTLLGVLPSEDQIAEAEWDLKEEDVFVDTTEQLAAARKLNEDTVKQLERESWERWQATNPTPVKARSEAYWKIKKYVG